MKIYKRKIERIINFIKNENKFKRTDYVKVIKNSSKNLDYNNYIGKRAIVTNINYDKKDYIVGLKFQNGINLDFKIDEIEKLDDIEMYSNEYKQLLKMI